MGRFRDAVRVLRGLAVIEDQDAADARLAAIDERYIRRDEVTQLVQQMAQLDADMALHYDKLNTLLARLNKREQRSRALGSSSGAEAGPDPSEVPNGGPRESKADLQRRVGALKLQGRL